MMYIGQQRIRSGRQDRARLNHCAGSIFPLVLKTGKGKQGIVLHSKVEGLFFFPAAPPFDKAACRQQAPAAHAGTSKGGLTCDSFRTRIDRLESDSGVRGP
jgi:hypothetical protein